MRLIAERLDGAFKTGHLEQICAAFRGAVEAQNKVKFAVQAGVDRRTLHRAFKPPGNPNLITVLRVLNGFELSLRAYPTVDGALDAGFKTPRSRVAVVAALNKAFQESDIESIRIAFSDAVNAQVNVSELARKLPFARTSLYRLLRRGGVQMKSKTILELLAALGLGLDVIYQPAKDPSADKQIRAPRI